MNINWPWRKKSTDTWSAFRDFLESAAKSKSGVSVTHKTALQAATAFACARVIAEGLAQVPLKVFKEIESGAKVVVKDNPLYSVLHDSPNDWQTSFEWRESAGLHLVFTGDHFSYINRVRGRVMELIPFVPGQVTVIRDGYVLGYKITIPGNKELLINQQDMLHLRGPSWDTWNGLDAIKLGRDAIGLSLAAEEHASRFFSNGARLGGMLSTDQKLTEEQVKLLKKSWQESQGGVENAYKTAVMFGGMTYTSAGVNNDNAQMVQVRNQQVEEICRIMRVLPIMVGYTANTSTYASAEQMFLAHVVHTMGPWYTRLEQAFNKYLLTSQERNEGLYTKFIVSGLLRGAHKDRAEYYAKALGSGGSPAWLTQDEIRELEEYDPMGGAASQLPVTTNAPKDSSAIP